MQSYWTWQHPDGYDDLTRQQAIVECENIAAEEMIHYDHYYFSPPLYDRDVYRDNRYLLRSHYYNLYRHREFTERRRYFRICMKSKGWRLVKQTPQPVAQ